MSPNQLSILSKLVLVIYPTHSKSLPSPLLLYSSVIRDEIWHLSLIGPSTAETHDVREVWWESQWCTKDLEELNPAQSVDQLIHNIHLSFCNDDIALKGYRTGDEAQVRLTMRYSIPELAFTVSLSQLDLSTTKSPGTFKPRPFLNLLEIACEAYQRLKRIDRVENSQQSRGNSILEYGISNSSLRVSSDHQVTRSSHVSNQTKQKQVASTSSQDLLARNLANPCKKAVSNRLDSDFGNQNQRQIRRP